MAASCDRGNLESLAAAVEVIAPPEAKARKRNLAPGVRVVGRRIYDPKNGKTCHQCRQKTMDFAVACNHVKKKGSCMIKYCKKCLLNRYGENAKEAAGNSDWTCPKCRGICNCSFCRKKKGKMPTGIMVHIAKASGCTSVHDLLEKGSDVVAAVQARLKVNDGLKQGTKRVREADFATGEVAIERDGNVGIDLNAVPSIHIKKKLKCHQGVKKNPAYGMFHDEDNGEPLLSDEGPAASNNNILLPKGTLVTNIAGAELNNEDIRAAIQLYGLCRSLQR